MLATYRRSLPPAHPAKREPGRPRRQFHSWQPETLQPWRRLRRSPRRGRLLLPRLLLPRLVAAGLLAAHPRDDGVHLPPRWRRDVAEMQPKCRQDVAEMQPKCRRGVAEVQPKCRRGVAEVPLIAERHSRERRV